MGIKIHKKQKRNISYKKQIQCNNSCRNTLYPSSQNIKKCCSKIWKGRERDETAVFIHRLYDFILGRKSSIKLPLSIMPPPSVISLPFKGKKVYNPPPPPLAFPKYSSLINDVLSSRNNNNGKFICVFECTIVNLATYRQFTKAAWDWIMKKKKTKQKQNKNKSPPPPKKNSKLH